MTKGDSRYPEPEEMKQRQAREARLAERAAEADASVGKGVTDQPAMSGLVIWLAKRLGEDPYRLAKRFPSDTLRRAKYPFGSERQEDGTTRFWSPTIVEGKELHHAPTTPGSRRDEARGGIEVRR